MYSKLESIDLSNLKVRKDKRGRGNRSRCVYYDEDFYYKIWGSDYHLINEFTMAIDSGFIDGSISPGFVSVIKDKNMINRGYIYKKCNKNYKDVSFYEYYFSYLKKKIKETKIFHFDLASCNIVLYNEMPSLIDLESFWQVKNFENIKDKVMMSPSIRGPKDYYNFIEEEYKEWLKNNV